MNDMRGTGQHTAPEGMQAEPADNTTEYVMRQVRAWAPTWPGNPTGDLIHPEAAMEIAAGWQSPGTDGIEFARFASTGTITDGLAEAIERELVALPAAAAAYPSGYVTGDLGTLEENTSALHALLAYVRACEVDTYTVTRTEVYDAQPDVETVERGGGAGDFRLTLLNALDDLLPEGECADCGPDWHECEGTLPHPESDGESCPRHAEMAHLAAALADGATVFRFDLADAGLASIIEYRLTRTRQTYGTYLDAGA